MSPKPKPSPLEKLLRLAARSGPVNEAEQRFASELANACITVAYFSTGSALDAFDAALADFTETPLIEWDAGSDMVLDLDNEPKAILDLIRSCLTLGDDAMEIRADTGRLCGLYRQARIAANEARLATFHDAIALLPHSQQDAPASTLATLQRFREIVWQALTVIWRSYIKRGYEFATGADAEQDEREETFGLALTYTAAVRAPMDEMLGVALSGGRFETLVAEAVIEIRQVGNLDRVAKAIRALPKTGAPMAVTFAEFRKLVTAKPAPRPTVAPIAADEDDEVW
jgi:hypothetical protein